MAGANLPRRRLYTTVFLIVFTAWATRMLTKCPDNKLRSSILSTSSSSTDSEDCTSPTFPNKRKTLNLIFQFNYSPVKEGGDILEYDWILNVLLAKINRPLRTFIDLDSKLMMNDSLVFVFKKPKNPSYFEQLLDSGYSNVGAFHMADEGFRVDVHWYTHLNYVFRNYGRIPALKEDRVIYVPLGIRDGFGSPNPSILLPASEREHLCTFMGSQTVNRMEMYQVIESKKIQCFTFTARSWFNKKNLGATEYRQILMSTKFALAPWGNNEESMRFWEGLQAGAIPVTIRITDKKRDWLSQLSDPPVIILNSWKEFPEVVQRYQSDPQALDQLQGKVMNWYRNYKTQIQTTIRHTIDKAIGDPPLDCTR